MRMPTIVSLLLIIVCLLMLAIVVFFTIQGQQNQPMVPAETESLPTLVPTAVPLPPLVLTTPAPELPGRLEITYPFEMLVGSADVITLEIIANPNFTEMGVYEPHATGVIQITSNEGRERYEAQIALFPIMEAEVLAGEGIFDVTSSNIDTRRTITPTRSASWAWSILAKEPGSQSFTISIFGVTSIDEEDEIRESAAIIERIIIVENTPALERLGAWLSSNFIALIGLLGTTGPLALWFTRKKSGELSKKVDGLEKKINALMKAYDQSPPPYV